MPAARGLLTLPRRRVSVVTIMSRFLAPTLVVLALTASGVSAQTKLGSECEAGDQRACATLARMPSAALEVRLGAVRRLTDQALLTDFANTSPVREIRLAAIHGLIDQAVLTDIARHAKGAVERGTAVERLQNQETVADIARHDTSRWVRQHAAYCLTDQTQIARLVTEDRRELLPTLVAGGGIRHVKVDGRDVRESLIGVTPILPGRHTISADFTVTENVTWDESSVNTATLDARLGATYVIEADIGIVTWQYLSPQTRRGRGTWKLVVREAVSPGPDLLPQIFRR